MKRRTLISICGVGIASVSGCTGFTSPQRSPDDAPAKSSNRPCEVSEGVSLTTESSEFVVIAENNQVETHVFTLSNETGCVVEIDAEQWVIEEQSGETWEQVETGGGGENRTIESGGEHEWSLSLSPHPTPDSDTTTFIVADLSEGTYRFSVTGTRSDGETVTREAQFEVVMRTESTSSSET